MWGTVSHQWWVGGGCHRKNKSKVAIMKKEKKKEMINIVWD